MGDPRGQVVVITGATSGLGQACAIDFAQKGAKVIIVGRDAARAKETQDAAKPATIEVVLGDVSTRAGAKAVAQQILAKAPRINVLINNAGGQFKQESKTADGIETTFALNTVGAFVLERELHQAIASVHGRVVNVATGFLNSFPVNPDQLAAPSQWKSLEAYAQSKHASVMMTVEQAKRYANDGVTYVAIHPGVIMGTRFNGGQPKIAQMIGGPIMRAIGFACTLDEAVRRFTVASFGDVPSGSYIVKGAPAPLPNQSNDAGVRTKVFSLLEKLAAA